MKNIFLILISVFLFLGCQKQKEEIIPVEIISLDTMSMIIADMHIVESISNFRGMMDTPESKKIEEQYSGIFSNYKITPERFRKSYDYYLETPERMDKVYVLVLEQLSKIQAELKHDNPI